MPSFLTKLAQRYWGEAVTELTKAGVVSLMDSMALSVYAEAFAAWRHAVEMVEKTGGQVVKARTGHPMENQWSVQVRRNQKELMKVLAQFGMTRSARTRQHIEAARQAARKAPVVGRSSPDNPFSAIRARRRQVEVP